MLVSKVIFYCNYCNCIKFLRIVHSAVDVDIMVAFVEMSNCVCDSDHSFTFEDTEIKIVNERK